MAIMLLLPFPHDWSLSSEANKDLLMEPAWTWACGKGCQAVLHSVLTTNLPPADSTACSASLPT